MPRHGLNGRVRTTGASQPLALPAHLDWQIVSTSKEQAVVAQSQVSKVTASLSCRPNTSKQLMARAQLGFLEKGRPWATCWLGTANGIIRLFRGHDVHHFVGLVKRAQKIPHMFQKR